jgi:hypothetical protein
MFVGDAQRGVAMIHNLMRLPYNFTHGFEFVEDF